MAQLDLTLKDPMLVELLSMAAGPITKALLKGGRRLKVSGKGSGLLFSLATNPEPVDVVLTTGGKPYCMTFGGTVKFTAGRTYSAKNASAPGACPP